MFPFRNFYKANPRPDALMKEQIVEMSGLSPRVIRVWFQNKRCKDKKNQIKFEMQQERVSFSIGPINHLIFSIQFFTCFSSIQERFKLGHEHSPGIKMIADSPVRPISPLNSHGLDVTQYQPPWQALNEFAMNSNFNNDHLDTNNPEFKRLLQQVCCLHCSVSI